MHFNRSASNASFIQLFMSKFTSSGNKSLIKRHAVNIENTSISYRTTMRRLKSILFVLFFHTINISAEDYDNSEDIRLKSYRGFFFSIPKTVLAGKNETVCISLHGAGFPSRIVTDLKIKEKHHITTKIVDSEHTCFELHIPNHHYKEPHLVQVQIQAQLNGTIFTSRNHDPILIYPNKKVFFVETDRSLYKSGDKVRIRILVLNQDLTTTKKYLIPLIKIRNPTDVTVSVWENLTTEFGLVHLEYQISEDAVEGKWTIQINEETKTFDVKRHILPRFKVSLHQPKTIYTGGSSVTFEVCAKYSFGYAVKGTALIKISSSVKHMKPLSRIKEVVNGCAEFEFSNEDLYLHELKRDEDYDVSYKPQEQTKQLYVTATVVEFGTSQVEVVTGKSAFTFNLYSLKFAPEEKYFQPGLPYRGKLTIFNNHTKLSKEVIEICYNVAVKRSWNIQDINQCSNFTVKNNEINFNILPLKNNVIHLRLKARPLNRTNVGYKSETFGGAFLVYRLYSPTSSYIYLEQQNVGNFDCKSYQQFTIYYTTDKFKENDNITFYYMIKSRGSIVKQRKITRISQKFNSNYQLNNVIGTKHKYTKLGVAYDKFDIKFRLDEKIVTKYQILVYYVNDNGETVATSKDISVEPCIQYKVDVLASAQYYPGEKALVRIKTAPNSLCSLSAVDKSTKFLAGAETLNVDKFLQPFLQEKDFKESSRITCVQHTRKNALVSFPEAIEETKPYDDLRRKKRHAHTFSEDFDAYDTFNKFGLVIITNLRLITKPCYNGPVIEDVNIPSKDAQFLRNHYDVPKEDLSVPIRSFFPETWLWELAPVGKSGQIDVSRELPHTITNWVTSVICASEDGFGMSKPLEIRAFQPFFVDVLVPYSIKRNEILHMHVKVFNFENYSLPIKMTLGDSFGLDLVGENSKRNFVACISANDSYNHVFRIKSSQLGQINVTVLVELESTYPRECGPEILINKRDVVFKTILVEPEGYQSGETKTTLLCFSDKHFAENATWNLDVPEDAVANTAKAHLLFNGDLLGPTIENLEKLLTVPTGCGEQIMATLAPNLYVLRYLNATGNLTPNMRIRIVRNIKIGYQRILRYMHKDGSFSAFGYHDPFGSMFLTTFVIRTLYQAKPFIYVDQNVINRGINWIFEHQLENGCFATMLHVFQDMGGTSTENSTAGLTSYILISLIESGIQIPEKVIKNAQFCIKGHHIPDKYTLAISTYALFLVRLHHDASRSLSRLMSSANRNDNMIWWSNQGAGSSSSSDIEITSYALLSLLQQISGDNLADAHLVARWLNTKRNSLGGFKTTQDTVVALDALSKYSTLVSNRNINLNINIFGTDQKETLTITSKDRLRAKKVFLKKPNGIVSVAVEGRGCVLVQAVLSYNLRHISNSRAFNLAVDVIPVSTIDKCSVTTINPCFTYTGPDLVSNMVVVEIGMPSGYEPDRASLYKLVEKNNNSIKKFEEIKDLVVFYLTELKEEQICAPFIINENNFVEARSDSVIKIYDYYKPEFQVTKMFRVSMCQPNDLSPIPLLEGDNNVTTTENTFGISRYTKFY